jgi:hypothetical protein
MLIRLLFVSFLLCFANVDAYAGNGNIKGIKRPIVKSVIIEINAGGGEVSSDTPPHAVEPCDDFILNESDVLEFFKKATLITQKEHTTILYTSRCFVRGRAILENGRNVGWRIDRFRRGWMWFPKSEKFKDIFDVYFFCGTCRSENYYEACDVKCALDDLRR